MSAALFALALGATVSFGQTASPHATAGTGVLRNPFPEFAKTYCLDCHNADDKKGKFDMESILAANPVSEFEAWESTLWALQDGDVSFGIHPRQMVGDDQLHRARALGFADHINRIGDIYTHGIPAYGLPKEGKFSGHCILDTCGDKCVLIRVF